MYLKVSLALGPLSGGDKYLISDDSVVLTRRIRSNRRFLFEILSRTSERWRVGWQESMGISVSKWPHNWRAAVSRSMKIISNFWQSSRINMTSKLSRKMFGWPFRRLDYSLTGSELRTTAHLEPCQPYCGPLALRSQSFSAWVGTLLSFRKFRVQAAPGDFDWRETRFEISYTGLAHLFGYPRRTCERYLDSISSPKVSYTSPW